MHLEANCTSAGLAFALAGCCFAEVGEVFAAHLIGREVGEFATATTVVDENLEVHLGFTAEFFDVSEELALVGPNRFAEAFVVVENCTESEGKNGGVFEAISDDSCMIDARFMVQGFYGIMFADDNCEVTGWVKENLISAYSVD